VKRKLQESALPVELKARDRNNIVHGRWRNIDKASLSVGVPFMTMCGLFFVTKHWKGNKYFKDRNDVVSMRVVDIPINCVGCIAEEKPHGT